MSVKERKINMLLALFAEKEIVTIQEIKDTLNINDRSVKSYIGYLRDYSIDVIPMNKKYKIITTQKLSGGILNSQEFRMVKVMMTIGENNGMLNNKNVVDGIFESRCDEDSISRKTIERAVKSCQEKGYIYLDEKNKFRVSLETDTIYVTNDEEVFKFVELCELYKGHLPFYRDVNKLKSKIIEQGDFEGIEYGVHCIGRKYSYEDALRNTIKQFEAFDYRRRVLRINYDSKIGNKEVFIQVVTMLYNWENDKSYVIGMVEGNEYFIDVKTIVAVQGTKLKNSFFNDDIIIKKIELMFGASLDGPYDVKVEFNNVFNINDKLNRLHKHRESSTLIKVENKLVYTDTIYGIQDFARYIRGFGSACRVLAPKELKDIMRKTYERILRNYGDSKNE
jgi:biotin operon repressor